MVTTLRQIEGLSQRLEKAIQIVDDGKVKPVKGMDGNYVVECSSSDGFYLVNGECTCPDSKQRGEQHDGWCKHNLAVEVFKERNGEGNDSGQGNW